VELFFSLRIKFNLGCFCSEKKRKFTSY